MDSLDSIYLSIVLGLVFATVGELFALATVTTFGVALVGLCLPVGLLVMTWQLVSATGRHVRTRDYFVNVDGILYPRT